MSATNTTVGKTADEPAQSPVDRPGRFGTAGSGTNPQEPQNNTAPPSAAGSWFNRLFILTIFKNRAANTKREEALTPLSLKQLLLSTTAPTKEKLLLLKLACFGKQKTPRIQKDGKWTGGCLRHNANMKHITGVEVEYDGEQVSFDSAVDLLTKAGILVLAYTTASHTVVAPRWRLLCPFSKDYAPGHRNAFVERLNGLLGAILSAESWTLSQSYYFGHVNGALDYRVELIDGTPIDQHQELDATSLGKSGKSKKATTGNQSPNNNTASPVGSGRAASVFTTCNGPNMADAMRAGLDKGGFADLPTDRQNDMLKAMLALPAITALADAGRKTGWLDVLFALADAERLGATDARTLALAWSETSTRFKDDADFDKDWVSFRQKLGGITVGTLINLAGKAGFNVAAWFHWPTPNPPPGAAPTGATGTARPPSWDTVPAIMDPAQAGPLLNQLIGFARQFGGGPSYFMRHPDGTVSPIGRDALAAMLAPYKVRIGIGTNAKLVSAATWWPTWRGRYAIDEVVYDPEGNQTRIGVTIENTWRGFLIEPMLGSWQLIHDHLLNIICGGVKNYFNYLICWLGRSVQRPGTAPETMIVMRSNEEGVGKSLVGQLMLRIFGRHGHEATGLNEIFGDFNEVIVGTSFVLLEENAFPGDHKLATAMKGIVTAASISINPKGRPRFSIPNMLHMVLTTNEEWAVPAGAAARRFFVLDVLLKMDAAYFVALWAEINANGVAAMLHDLLLIDLSQFNPRNVPVTPALVRQQRMSADDITQWITDAVVDNSLVPESALLSRHGVGGFGQDVPGPVLYGAYCTWSRNHGTRRPKGSSVFGRALTQLGMVRGRSNNIPKWTVPDALTLLTNANKRASIRKVTP